MLTINTSRRSNWPIYWGAMPLPAHAASIGTITRDGQTGALIRLSNGNYVQGNAGGIRGLDQAAVKALLARDAEIDIERNGSDSEHSINYS